MNRLEQGRRLLSGATPAPWSARLNRRYGFWSVEPVADIWGGSDEKENAEAIAWLRNNADALLAVAENVAERGCYDTCSNALTAAVDCDCAFGHLAPLLEDAP